MSGAYLDEVMTKWKLDGSISSHMRIVSRYKNRGVLQSYDATNNWKLTVSRLSHIRNQPEIQTKYSRPNTGSLENLGDTWQDSLKKRKPVS